jgi:DNA (cytosine-5)-methyltransferase 1
LWFTKSRRAQNDQDYETWIVGGVSPTLNAFDNAHETRATVLTTQDKKENDMMQVRRLTPTECERLMGWPDNHTATGTTGPVSDTNRYKMCGNGVASPVAEWIAEHLMAIPMLNKARPDAE